MNLYREALVHFQGGPLKVNQAVEVFSGPRRLGVQNLNLLNEHTAFAVTSKPRGAGVIRDHLDRLLHHTQLKAIQWINLNRHVVEFTTLSKRGTDRIMAGQNHIVVQGCALMILSCHDSVGLLRLQKNSSQPASELE